MSEFSDFFGSIGGGISDVASSVWDQLSGLFGGSTSDSGVTSSTAGSIAGTDATSLLQTSTPSVTSTDSVLSSVTNPLSTSTSAAGATGNNAQIDYASGAGLGTDSSTQQAASQQMPSSKSWLSSLSSDLGLDKTSTGDILKGLVGAGGLAYNVVKNSGDTSAEKAVEQQAKNASSEAAKLESYLANGTLPPGAQQYVNQQAAASKAAILSKYAALGMSGSTAEAQELANVNATAQSNMYTIATELYKTGITQTEASEKLYSLLMNAENQDNSSLTSAISNFVSGLSGK